MTEQEMGGVLAIIRTNLPGVFLQQTEEDAKITTIQWTRLFGDKPAALVQAAAETYCYRTTDRKSFPTPGNIREIVEEFEKIVEHMAYGDWLEVPKDKPFPTSALARLYNAVDARCVSLYGASRKQRIAALYGNATGTARPRSLKSVDDEKTMVGQWGGIRNG